MEDKEFIVRLGIEVRVARIRSRMRLEDLSKATGLSMDAIHKIEAAKTEAGVGTLKRIADATNCNIRDFFID